MTAARHGTVVELLDAQRHRSPALPGEHAAAGPRHHGFGHDGVDVRLGAGAVARPAIAEPSGR